MELLSVEDVQTVEQESLCHLAAPRTIPKNLYFVSQYHRVYRCSLVRVPRGLNTRGVPLRLGQSQSGRMFNLRRGHR